VAINLGSSQELSIAELAKTIADVIGYTGKIVLDNSKPNGTPQKLLNSEKINLLGWKAQIDLRNGIEKTYNWFLNNNAKGSV
jgi:GDP-L-fucose synthase